MQFYFIRHAQSENNLLFVETGSMQGRSADPDLSATGWEQARVLAEYLAQHAAVPADIRGHDVQNVQGYAFTHLYCSLMIRSVATGVAVARALQLPLVAWADLHETGGIYCMDEQTDEHVGLPGRDRAYFERHYPELVLPDSLDDRGWWNRPWEAYEERPLRARRVLQTLLARHGHSSDRVAVISHGGFYNQLVRAILNLAQDERLWFSLNNAAISRFDFEGEDAWVSYMNHLAFMPPELVT
jgi:2,3-bisphosphoglycerate-dependent phosphoglycerate mutase